MKKNLRVEIKNGNCCIGMYVGLSDPSIVEMAAYAGYDFIRIDCEHTMFNPQIVAQMIRTANLVELPVFVRVSSKSDITRLLDVGATGIMAPHIDSKKTAQEIINEVKYAPLGQRGMFGTGGCTKYGDISLNNYIKSANEEVFLVVQIEDRFGIENIDEILSLEGVDMVATGKNDLSQSYGFPGRPNHPDVIAAENYVIKKALDYGKIPTMLANSKERVEELKRNGVRCFMTGRDSVFAFNGMKQNVSMFKYQKET